MRKIVSGIVVALVLVLSLPPFTSAQRRVVVNGQRWSAADIAAFERRCGPMLDGIYRVEGDYWWNVWNPRHAGRLSQLCHSNHATAGRAAPGYNRRGPFGDSMSDGRCSFVNGIPVGQCD